MARKRQLHLTRREEQIMGILFRRGEASVADLEELLPDSPTSGAVRRLLNILYSKGSIVYRHDGARKIYRANIKKTEAGNKALQQVVDTFFSGSATSTMGALFRSAKLELSNEERKLLSILIKRAKEKGR
jgi:predicted transcriptional regulator